LKLLSVRISGFTYLLKENEDEKDIKQLKNLYYTLVGKPSIGEYMKNKGGIIYE